MPDKGTMQDHIDDLMSVNKQLRAQRDHYRRAMKYMAEQLARNTPQRTAEYFFDDALFETAHG